MTTTKKLIIVQTVLILLTLIIGWFSIYIEPWHLFYLYVYGVPYYFGFFNIFLWLYASISLLFFVPTTVLYFNRKNYPVKLRKFFRLTCFFSIIITSLIFLTLYIDRYLFAESEFYFFGGTWQGISWVFPSMAPVVYFVIIGLLWWAVRINKKISL